MADDARMELLFKIRAQTDEALREIRALTGETEGMGNKTKQATDKANDGFGGLTERLKGMATPLAAVGAATAAVAAAMEAARQAAAAMNREMERTGNASRDYQTAFGNVLSNMKGASPREVMGVDAALRSMAGQFALGSQGPVMLADAFAAARTALPSMSNQALLNVVAEVAQEMQVSPTASPGAISLAIGSVMSGTGGRLNANQAQNLLGVFQGQSFVGDMSKIATMAPKLATAAEQGGMTLPDMFGLAAFATQKTGDTTGDRTANFLSVLSGKTVNNNAELQKALGFTLQGSLSNRLMQLATARRTGFVTDEQLQKAMSALGAEGVNANVVRAMSTPEGYAELVRTQARMSGPDIMTRDYTGEAFMMMASMPGGAERFAADRTASALAAERAGNALTAGLSFDTDRVKMELEAMGFNESGVRAGVAKFLGVRRAGGSVSDAEAAARGAANIGALPFGVGAAYGGLAEAESGGTPFLGRSAGTGGVPMIHIGTLQMQTNDTRRVQDQIMEDAGFPLSAGGGG